MTDQQHNHHDTPPVARRSIYLLPNTLTTLALCLGFYAIIATTNGGFEQAATAIILAAILDGLDGRIARLTNTQSEFGSAYDSLSDVVCFGVAPGLLLYSWALAPLGKVGWAAAFIYTAAVALRLARFHSRVNDDRRYFYGLPCPAAASVTAAIIWWSASLSLAGHMLYTMLALAGACLLAILMVSPIHYYSFKVINFRGTVSLLYAIGIIVFIGLLLANPPAVLTLVGVAYIISGVVLTLWKKQRQRTTSL